MSQYARCTAIALQWGRDQLIAESDQSFTRKTVLFELQWGRDQLIAESPRILHRHAQFCSFNGAAIN